MKTSTATIELARMTPKELRQELLVARTGYAKMRMAVEMQTEKNHAKFKMKRRDIARMASMLILMEKNTSVSDKAKKKPDVEAIVSSVSPKIRKTPSQSTKKSVQGVRSAK